MARDMNLFVDDDGIAYHIYSSEENSTLHISQLTDDYTSYSGKAPVSSGAFHGSSSLVQTEGEILFDYVRLYGLGSECGTIGGRFLDLGTLEGIGKSV